MMNLIYEMNEWIHTYYGNGTIFWIVVAAYVYLFAVSDDKRWKFVYPVILTAFLLANPILYKYVYEETHYWRWLWSIPNAFVISAAAVHLIRSMKKKWHKAVLCMIMVLSLLLFGENYYKVREHWFFPTENVYKMEDETIDVCEIMLGTNPQPKCICPFPLCNRVRLYSGEILQYYGRDAEWAYESTDNPKVNVLKQLESEEPDYTLVLQAAVENECGYVVTHADRPIEQSVLNEYQFHMIGETQLYTVYQHGI